MTTKSRKHKRPICIKRGKKKNCKKSRNRKYKMAPYSKTMEERDAGWSLNVQQNVDPLAFWENRHNFRIIKHRHRFEGFYESDEDDFYWQSYDDMRDDLGNENYDATDYNAEKLYYGDLVKRYVEIKKILFGYEKGDKKRKPPPTYDLDKPTNLGWEWDLIGKEDRIVYLFEYYYKLGNFDRDLFFKNVPKIEKLAYNFNKLKIAVNRILENINPLKFTKFFREVNNGNYVQDRHLREIADNIILDLISEINDLLEKYYNN